MPTPTHTPSPATAHTQTAHTEHRLSAKKFTLHFLEMVVAMAVGMVALHPVWTLGLDAVGAPGLMDNPYTGALTMATNMTVAMSAWMKIRVHRWRRAPGRVTIAAWSSPSTTSTRSAACRW